MSRRLEWALPQPGYTADMPRLTLDDLLKLARACRLAAGFERSDRDRQANPSVKAVFEKSATYYDGMAKRFDAEHARRIAANEHDCDRKGKPTTVIDDPGGADLPMIVPTCSVCGKPQVF